MSFSRMAKMLGLLSAEVAGLLICTTMAPGQVIDHCCCTKCPPAYVHCQEGPPKIKWKGACPKPVCDPCSLDHFGYYQNYWRPWPWGTNFAHCCDFGTEGGVVSWQGTEAHELAPKPAVKMPAGPMN